MTQFINDDRTRRTFLRIGSGVLAVPFLETFASARQASATPPKRVIFLGGGFGFTKDTFYPKKAGRFADIGLTEGLRAFEAGAHGVISSPQEARLIRALPEAEGRLIVTPGVRPAGADKGDQKRVATPANAIASGADHVVVGRPIHMAPDPTAAARAIVDEIRSPQATAPNL